ncbi:glucose-1-phosphate adenylyltransferase subunit GlgD [Jeotgalibaca sp. A127]|uniref:glucose-1-phosphate adenylyltransferase subunit GlgD n=1 Tax=Jeotgalibaca sp. A127 TaxID=3457324 RepID=UPI003FD5954A
MRMNKITAILSLTDPSTREMQPLTTYRPVAALPFASRYRALDFHLSNLSHAEMDSAAIFIGGSGRSVYDHIRSGAVWNLESNLSGGIFTFSQTYMKQQMSDQHFDENYFYENQKEFLVKSKAEFVVVGGGKIVASLDFSDIRDFHMAHSGDMTVVYKNMPVQEVQGHPHEKVLRLDGDHDVLGFVSSADFDYTEDKVPMSLNFYMLSVSKLLELIDRADKEGIRMDIDRLVAYYAQFYQVDAYEHKGPIANLDSIKSYFEANMALLDKDYYDAVFHGPRRIITKVKNEAPTYYCDGANVKRSLLATGGFIAGSIENSMVFRKVEVAKNAEIRDSIIMQGAKIGEGAVLEYCILDKNVTIEPGVVLKGSKDNLIVIEKNRTVQA